MSQAMASTPTESNGNAVQPPSKLASASESVDGSFFNPTVSSSDTVQPSNVVPSTPVNYDFLDRAPMEHCPIWDTRIKVEESDCDPAEEKARRKKASSEVRQKNRKRQQDMQQGKIPRTVVKSGRKNTFREATTKFQFLDQKLEEMKAIKKGKHRAITRMFLERFGRNLPLGKDPVPNLNYTPYKVKDFPKEEQDAEFLRREAYDECLFKFLSNWCGTHTASKRAEKGLVKSIMSAFRAVAGQPSKISAMNPEIEYGKRHWEEGLREKFYKIYPEGLDPKLFLKNYRHFMKKMYASLPETFRESWVAQLKKEEEESLEMKVDEGSQDKHQRAVEFWSNKEKILPIFLDTISDAFGMGCTMILYGPVGSDGGKINVFSCEACYDIPASTDSSSSNSAATGLFMKTDPSAHQAIHERLKMFATQLFPEVYCHARASAHEKALMRSDDLSDPSTADPPTATNLPTATTNAGVAELSNEPPPAHPVPGSIAGPEKSDTMKLGEPIALPTQQGSTGSAVGPNSSPGLEQSDTMMLGEPIAPPTQQGSTGSAVGPNSSPGLEQSDTMMLGEPIALPAQQGSSDPAAVPNSSDGRTLEDSNSTTNVDPIHGFQHTNPGPSDANFLDIIIPAAPAQPPLLLGSAVNSTLNSIAQLNNIVHPTHTMWLPTEATNSTVYADQGGDMSSDFPLLDWRQADFNQMTAWTGDNFAPNSYQIQNVGNMGYLASGESVTNQPAYYGMHPGYLQNGMGPGYLQSGMGPGYLQNGVSPGYSQNGMGFGYSQNGMGFGFLRNGMGPGYLQNGMGPGYLQNGINPAQNGSVPDHSQWNTGNSDSTILGGNTVYLDNTQPAFPHNVVAQTTTLVDRNAEYFDTSILNALPIPSIPLDMAPAVPVSATPVSAALVSAAPVSATVQLTTTGLPAHEHEATQTPPRDTAASSPTAVTASDQDTQDKTGSKPRKRKSSIDLVAPVEGSRTRHPPQLFPGMVRSDQLTSRGGVRGSRGQA